MHQPLLAFHEIISKGLFALFFKLRISPYNFRRSPIMTNLAALLESQWFSRERLEELQLQKTKLLLAHAYENVPYYKKIFDDAGFDVTAFRSMDELEKLPVLTKKDIQDNLLRLLAKNFTSKEYYKNATGGSTGHPLTFYQSYQYEAWGLADIWRNFMMCGFTPGERRAFLWGSDYDSNEHKGWKRFSRDLLRENMFWVNTFDLNEELLAKTVRKLVSFQPQLIVAYVSSAVLFAQYIKENNIRIRPRALQTSAEVLTPSQRKLLEEAFVCPVFDRYGCREVGNIAHECESHSGLHLLAENNFTEFLHDNKKVSPGETGLITVTNLNNWAMPFIRYQIGDLGRPSLKRCSCNRGLPMMEMVDGRSTDFIISPSGKMLHGEFFTHIFYGLEGVRQFQVIQTSPKSLKIKIVPFNNFHREEALDFLRKTILEHGDPAFEFSFEFLDKIPPMSSGKFRFVSSELPFTSCKVC